MMFFRMNQCRSDAFLKRTYSSPIIWNNVDCHADSTDATGETRQTKFAVFIKIIWCGCVASAAVQRNKLFVLSLPDRQEKVG